MRFSINHPHPAFPKPVDSDGWVGLVGSLKEGCQALFWNVFHTHRHNGDEKSAVMNSCQCPLLPAHTFECSHTLLLPWGLDGA